MGLATNKLDGTTDVGADIDDKYNALIDALLTAFDIDSGVQSYTTTPKTDAIAEKTTDAGVTVDGCLIKDGKAADSNKLGGTVAANYLSTSKVYDSGWFAVINNATYVRAHNLLTTKLLIQMYWSSTSDGSSDVWTTQFVYWEDTNNNPYTVGSQIKNITVSSCTLETGTQGTFMKIDKTYSTGGYCRIIVLALE